MELKELLKFLLEKQKKCQYVVSFKEICEQFTDEKAQSINIQLHRFAKEGMIVPLVKGYYTNPFMAEEKPETILLELAKKLRPNDKFYLSLEYDAFECNMINQVPNGFTFVTTGRSYRYYTPVGVIHFTHLSNINLESEYIFQDKWRGIYVAEPKQIIMDAIKLKKFDLIDLILEKNDEYKSVEDLLENYREEED